MVARRALPVLISLLPLAVPATASAGVASRANGTDVLMLTENGAETNSMTVTLSNGVYTIKDVAGMGAGANCDDANPGDDTVTCPAAAVVTLTADLGPGNDRFVSTVATPAKVLGGTGLDDLAGGPGPDELIGGPGSDTLRGGAGNDVMMGETTAGDSGTAQNTMDGGDGDDTMDGGGGSDTMAGGADADDASGGGGADVISGDAGPDVLGGGDGNDTVDGGDGNDLIAGGPGDDQLNGSAPGLPGAPAGKRVSGPVAAGFTNVDDDTLDGGDGNDSFDGGPGADRMIGGPGIDGTSYASAVSPVFVSLDDKADDGAAGEGDRVDADVENLGGWRGRDTFTGSDAGNFLSSAGGEDYLDGAGGVDSMSAGAGFDVVRSRDGLADVVDCGSSKDFAILDKKDSVSGSCERINRGLVKRPRLGRLLVLRPLRGGEAFGLQGMRRTVPLQDQLGLPPGVKLDATSGAVRLTTATAGGRSQSGDFSQGAFLVKQRRSARGLTELALTGGDLAKCANARAKVRGAAARTVLRRLFGRARGRFRTRGRFSTATVRGTEWTVIDRCDGTLTTVKSGTVVVRDRVRHRTVTLKAGQRYLARRGNR